MGNSFKSANFLMESRLADAARGDADALLDLGMAYSSGSGGVEVDLIEAHKWFNLAALKGRVDAIPMRREVAELMSDVEIAAAALETLTRDLKALIEGDLARLKADFETSGAPWTPGR